LPTRQTEAAILSKIKGWRWLAERELVAMIRDPHFKSPRLAGWAAAAALLLALPSAASAQGLFSIFGGSPSADEIERRLEASGYIVTGPLVLRGDIYVAEVLVRGEGPERLIVDPQSGRVLQRFRSQGGDRWREAAVPPDAWGDDPRTWNGPRPPADISPGPPPDGFDPSGPDAGAPPPLEPKKVEIKPKPKPAPVANVVNPPAAAPSPAATVKPAAPVLAKPAAPSTPAAAASPSPTPSAVAAPPPSPAAPAIQAAKADAPIVPPKPPAAAPTPAKTKSVNDIPVTPLD
jgi:hypothetical protein